MILRLSASSWKNTGLNKDMGKYDSSIKFAEEQVKRMKDQISLYKKFKNPGWEAAVESLTRQITSKQKAIADMKKRNK